jgi:hypothetical protein
MQRTWIALALSLGLTACGPRGSSVPVSMDELTAIEANIRAAEAAGGQHDPRASRYLRRARQQVADAHVRSTQGDNIGANILIDRAALDAELALELTRLTAMRRQADARQARGDDAEEMTP